jgi:hypothetical protein
VTTGWIILVYLAAVGEPPHPVMAFATPHVFSVENEAGCKAEAAQIHQHLKAYNVECVCPSMNSMKSLDTRSETGGT